MSITQTMPGSPTSNTASPSSVDSPTLPRTPETPSTTLQPMIPDAVLNAISAGDQPATSAAAAAAAAAKRKPSRRANTAERRATHNAVERQRRETLNSRFLVSSTATCVPAWNEGADHLCHVMIFPPIGSSWTAPEPVPDPPPKQVRDRQFFYRAYPCVASPPDACCTRASFAQGSSSINLPH